MITEFPIGIFFQSRGIAGGPDGNVWFTGYNGARVGRITPLGVVTEFTTGITAGAQSRGITAGPDGNMWFTEQTGNRIARITIAGAPVPTPTPTVTGTPPPTSTPSPTVTGTVPPTPTRTPTAIGGVTPTVTPQAPGGVAVPTLSLHLLALFAAALALSAILLVRRNG
ncbi:MAG: hypothetical protein LC796_11080 [Acidobacteria bacterium]|nr:hypothetical protein [Acidobacteriota bacterium]MCA1617369.1 hypothetical protein [Acidobacteriota bacterium]